jgi:hypothetical protein
MMAAAVGHVALSIRRQAEGKSEVIVLKLLWACTSRACISWACISRGTLHDHAPYSRESHGHVSCGAYALWACICRGDKNKGGSLAPIGSHDDSIYAIFGLSVSRIGFWAGL